MLAARTIQVFFKHRLKLLAKKAKKNVILLNRIAIISGLSVRVIIRESNKDLLKIQIMQLPHGWAQTLNMKVPSKHLSFFRNEETRRTYVQWCS
jgi:hypothetical protein